MDLVVKNVNMIPQLLMIRENVYVNQNTMVHTMLLQTNVVPNVLLLKQLVIKLLVNVFALQIHMVILVLPVENKKLKLIKLVVKLAVQLIQI